MYSVLLAFVAALLMGPIYDVWDHHTLGLTIAGSLVVFAAVAITSALQGWLGMVGTGLAVLLLVVLGNPGSGGIFPPPFLPSFFRGMHRWIPPGLGTDLVRGVAYFNRKATGLPLTGLTLWAILGVAGLIGATLVLGRRAERAL